MPDMTIKQGSLEPTAQAVLGKTGVPDWDLAGATGVTFTMRNAKTDDVVIDHVAGTIVSETDRLVEYAWAAGDTATPGFYYVEWEVTLGSGKTIVFPTDGYNTIEITETLA